MKRLIQGKMYFSNVDRFRQIEKELGKGQGDAFEAMLRYSLPNSTTLNISIDRTTSIPIFCITALGNDNCLIRQNDGKRSINLKPKYREQVQRDFKDADTVVIFSEPIEFIRSIESTAVTVHDAVKYFDLNLEHQDFAFHEYLVESPGDISARNPIILSTQFQDIDGTLHPKQYITKRNAHRILFCKDQFFQGEREYRFAFIQKHIQEPQEYSVRFGKQKKTIMPLDDFFENGIFI
jgi:hypothetical protein